MIKVETQGDGIVITGYQVVLRPLKNDDLALTLAWRNSEFVRQQMLNDEIISNEQHQNWFNGLHANKRQMHWLVEYKTQAIGVTNIRTVQSDECIESALQLSPGMYIGNSRYWGNIVAFAPTLAMYDYCFQYLKTEQFLATVKATNQAALNYNKQLGYQTVNTNGDWYELALDEHNYVKSTEKLKGFMSRNTNKTRGSREQ